MYLFRTNADVWLTLAREQSQFASVIDYVLELMGGSNSVTDNGDGRHLHSPVTTSARSSLFDVIDTGGGAAVKVVSSEACALTAALGELIKVQADKRK